jgi:hypothetical protein
MPAAAPAVHASYMKNLFAALEAQGRLSALAARQPELVRAVADASRLAWLPVERNVQTVESIVAAFGEERGLALLADCVYRQFETPLWSGFVGGAVRLLGTDPGSLGRWIPEAIRLAFRHCGRWTAERSDETELSVRVHELPALLAAHPLWLRSFATGMTPLFTLCGRDGNARLVEANEAERRAAYLLHWKARR